jgi:hypothetical protein
MAFLLSPEYVGQCALAMNYHLQLKTQSPPSKKAQTCRNVHISAGEYPEISPGRRELLDHAEYRWRCGITAKCFFLPNSCISPFEVKKRPSGDGNLTAEVSSPSPTLAQQASSRITKARDI